MALGQADLDATAKYFFPGQFDRVKFRKAFADQFSKTAHYDAAAIPDMEALLAFIEADTRVADIRWMAYMLATVFWETTSLKKYEVPTKGKNGKPLLGKNGQPIMHTVKKWAITMKPVEEVGHGSGRAYFLPVKVKRLEDGTARVTEQDGDQFTIRADGKNTAINKGAKLGSVATAKATKTYDDDDGEEHAYFGRGYVQLTWWSNYAKQGVAIGEGLDLLFNPDRVEDPEIAYKIMSNGMITGAGFANGHRLDQYFSGAHTDYVGARHMVNGVDHNADIAKIAEGFEAVLLQSKPSDDGVSIDMP
jgi:hypothetical protein